jgi:DNA-binding CsgD family transcriptional regulator
MRILPSLGLVVGGWVILLARDGPAQAPLPVYADYLVNGFQDWGWATRNYVNTSPVHSGACSVAVTFSSAWDGLRIYRPDFDSNNALSAGATGYLLEQTPREELLSALGEVHRGGSPMTSNIARKVVQSFKHTSAPAPPGEELSPREQEVLELLARGYLYKEISERLNISVPTVNIYIRRMYEKLHVRSRAQAVAKYAHLSDSEQRPPAATRVR